MVVWVGEVVNGTDGDKNWEIEKRSKHFSFGDHFINSYNLFSYFCIDIVFDIVHSWDLKGYMNVQVSVAWVRLLLTVTWQPVHELCIFSCNLSSLHICCHITTNLFKRNPWLLWQKYAARPGDVVRLLRTLGLVECRHVLELCSLYM